MIRLIAVFFGIAFIFAGAAGFMQHGGALLGMFAEGSMRNIVNIVSGVIAIMAATQYKTTKLYFLIFGIVYILAAIVGFVHHNNLFFMQVTTADSILHLIIGIIFLLLLYYFKKN